MTTAKLLGLPQATLTATEVDTVLDWLRRQHGAIAAAFMQKTFMGAVDGVEIGTLAVAASEHPDVEPRLGGLNNDLPTIIRALRSSRQWPTGQALAAVRQGPAAAAALPGVPVPATRTPAPPTASAAAPLEPTRALLARPSLSRDEVRRVVAWLKGRNDTWKTLLTAPHPSATKVDGVEIGLLGIAALDHPDIHAHLDDAVDCVRLLEALTALRRVRKREPGTALAALRPGSAPIQPTAPRPPARVATKPPVAPAVASDGGNDEDDDAVRATHPRRRRAVRITDEADVKTTWIETRKPESGIWWKDPWSVKTTESNRRRTITYDDGTTKTYTENPGALMVLASLVSGIVLVWKACAYGGLMPDTWPTLALAAGAACSIAYALIRFFITAIGSMVFGGIVGTALGFILGPLFAELAKSCILPTGLLGDVLYWLIYGFWFLCSVGGGIQFFREQLHEAGEVMSDAEFDLDH